MSMMKGLSKRCQSLVGLVVDIHGLVAFPILPIDTEIYLDYRNILYRFLSPFNCHKLANNVSVLSGCSEDWAIIGMPTIWYISEPLWGITCNKTVVTLSYKWNEYYFQLLWIGLLVTIPYVALQFRRNSGVLKSCVRQVVCVSRMCADPSELSEGTFVEELWFVKLAYRACVTDACNLDVNNSAVIQKQYRTFDVIKLIATECVLVQQGVCRSNHNSRRCNGFMKQKKYRAATVRLMAPIGWWSLV